MMKAIQKSSENTNAKTKTMTKTKTQKRCTKHPTSKYDDRYLTLVIRFTPVILVTLVTLVTLFQSYIQFYRAECITVSGFLCFVVVQRQKWICEEKAKCAGLMMMYRVPRKLLNNWDLSCPGLSTSTSILSPSCLSSPDFSSHSTYHGGWVRWSSVLQIRNK